MARNLALTDTGTSAVRDPMARRAGAEAVGEGKDREVARRALGLEDRRRRQTNSRAPLRSSRSTETG